jgi:glycosyltransferase involved in cell wall biosynthesis
MSLGKLVVASSAGCQAEMIGADGQCGILFDWNKPGDCTAALERALGMSARENGVIGARARVRISALTDPEQIGARRIAHFEEVVARSKRRKLFPAVSPGYSGNVQPVAPDTMPGLLSVVVPFYNLGQYVEETIASIASSTYVPLEIVILDDGSDNTESLAAIERARAQHSALVRVVRTENGGLARARNAGAQAARGEFLAFVDADDLVDPTFFEQGVAALRRFSNASFVYSWVRLFEGWNGIWPTWHTELPYLLVRNMLAAFVVARRSDFLTYGRNNPAIAYSLEDHESWINMVAHGCIGISIPEPLVRYRIRHQSMSHSMREDLALYLMELIADQHPSLYRQYGMELFGLLNENGSGLGWDHPGVATHQLLVEQRRYITNLEERNAHLVGAYEDLRDQYMQIRRYFNVLNPILPRLKSLLLRRRG